MKLLPSFLSKRAVADLTEREILALAIANEEEDSQIYQAFAEACAEEFPASARMFEDMAEEGVGQA